MFSVNYLLFCIFMLLALGAIIAFSYFVIKPLQTRWAIVKARKIIVANQTVSEWQFRNIYRMLATARNDLEATKLWHQLDARKTLPAELP